MKIEKLAENKIKVMLTTADLTDMNMDISALESNSADLNNFLFLLMERIKEETGFNPYGGQVLMEAFPVGEGLNIMVSKVHNETKKITEKEFKRIRSVRPKICESNEDAEELGASEPFYIKSFEDVCMLLKELDNELLLSGALYELGDEYCFLIPKNADAAKISVITEFAYRRSYHALQSVYIKEHGRRIAAGRSLFNMAEGIKSM